MRQVGKTLVQVSLENYRIDDLQQPDLVPREMTSILNQEKAQVWEETTDKMTLIEPDHILL